MKDSKGSKISIGDRVTVLWGFDNKFHDGNVVRLSEKFVDIDILSRRISIKDQKRVTKIL
ncbi:MAG: hypothetical protein MUP85_14035 [Candidatus Lokiarchaeota archaeon]|nr:hypothetical protein [Candidatus Lokiarchaeota archaeon]